MDSMYQDINMMQPLKVHLTRTGYDELTEELEKLKSKEPSAVDRVTKAREFGDLSENSEYHAAREDLAMIQGRIEELEELLARAEIVKKARKNGAVSLGSEVTVQFDGKEITYVLVGEYEADPLKKKISIDSPLGRALLGKKPQEQVEIEAPVGKIIYTIKTIN